MSILGMVLPAEKLLDCVKNAVGVLYNPIHIKRMAKAEAEKIKLLSNAMENSSVPVTVNADGVTLDSSDWREIFERTGQRLAFQELLKQQNIEAVIRMSHEELQDRPPVPSTPVDAGWMSRFFDSAAYVSDEELRKLWAKILAGKIIRPGNFSLRTMEILRNISPEEARLFEKIAPFVLNFVETSESERKSEYYICSKRYILEKYGIDYVQIFNLDDCGFLASHTVLWRSCLCEKTVLSVNGVKCKTNYNGSLTVELQAYPLKTPGIELLSVINAPCNMEYVKDVMEELNMLYEYKGFSITLEEESSDPSPQN